MMSFDLVAVYLMINIIVYLMIQLPFAYRSLKSGFGRVSDRSLRKSYPPLGWTAVLIVVTLTTSYFFIVFFAWPFYHLFFNSEIMETTLISLPFSTPLQIIGMVLVGAATAVNIAGRVARGESYTSDGVPDELSIELGHRVVRHPLYASYCYYFLGFQFLFQSYLILPLLLGIFGYYSAAKKEEEVLVEEFGEDYKKYQKEVGMLIPFLR